jgi:endonuclease/exonuclease/phosphatase family metal-dependent hydrolase
MRKILFLTLFISPFIVFSQSKYKAQIAMIGFYNCENFYDTVNNPIVNDEEFLPNGPKHYNSAIYWNKVEHIATVLSKIGTDVAGMPNPDGLSIIGVAEIENDTVLNDLVNHEVLKSRGYKIVHYDSRDARGVDVALLYNPNRFVVERSDKLFVKLPSGSKDAWYTRDVLWVRGKLDGESIDVYVNHWPSRSGGEERSAPARAAAASVVKHHMDSVANADGNQKVVIMGDLNDDPVSPSVAEVLGAKGKAKDVRAGGIFNPWTELYKNGIGTLAYQDNWNLFDQIMISYPWLNREQKGYYFYKQFIFNREFMMENVGRYKGYPMRTWDGNSYRGGYSDHFPTYLIFVKKVEG